MVLEKLKVNKHKPYKIQIKQLPWLVAIKEPRGLDSTLLSSPPLASEHQKGEEKGRDAIAPISSDQIQARRSSRVYHHHPHHHQPHYQQ